MKGTWKLKTRRSRQCASRTHQKRHRRGSCWTGNLGGIVFVIKLLKRPAAAHRQAPELKRVVKGIFNC
jgi:hypothetical protein